MVSTFHKDHLEKPTVISAPLDFVLPMAQPIIYLPAKRKWKRLKEYATKCVKWGDKEESS